jgi:L-fucose mutarotase/ribose pyranase (RbsD/FucU family)
MGKISIVLRLDKPRQRLQFYSRVSEYFPILYSSGARFYISFIFRCVANVVAEKKQFSSLFLFDLTGV